MNITMGQIYSTIRLLLRILLPATIFIILCVVVFVALLAGLQLIPDSVRQVFPASFSLYALVCCILFIGLGIAFIFFEARFLRKHFGDRPLSTQRLFVFLSGIPFYVIALLFIFTLVFGSGPNVSTAALFISAVGFVGFFVVSCVYIFLTYFLVRRSRIG